MNSEVEVSSSLDRMYKYLILFAQQNGYAPTRSELSTALGMSRYDVYKLLRDLEKEGLIKIVKRKPRAIKLCHFKLVKTL